MNALRIGCVEYINALPFYLPLKFGEIVCSDTFFFAVPSKINSLFRNKELDIALISSVEYLDGSFRQTRFGIAAEKKILSVNFYISTPLPSLSGKRVGLTPQSAASIELLKVLCYHLWKIEPLFESINPQEPYTNYAGVLLIGDEALQNLSIPGFQTIDLSTAWYEMTGLPFVFALFAARDEIAEELLNLFQKQLDFNLDWSFSHQQILWHQAQKNCLLDPDLIEQYYSLIQYRLSDKEKKGLELFKKLRKEI